MWETLSEGRVHVEVGTGAAPEEGGVWSSFSGYCPEEGRVQVRVLSEAGHLLTSLVWHQGQASISASSCKE